MILLDPHFYILHPKKGYFKDFGWSHERFMSQCWSSMSDASAYAQQMFRWGEDGIRDLMQVQVIRFDNDGIARWAQKILQSEDLPTIRHSWFNTKWPAMSNDVVSIAEIFRQADWHDRDEHTLLEWFVELDDEEYVRFNANSRIMYCRDRETRDKERAWYFKHEYALAVPIYVMENIFFFANQDDAAMWKLSASGDARSGNLKEYQAEFRQFIVDEWGEESAKKIRW